MMNSIFPFTDEVVQEVDFENKIIVLNPPTMMES